VCNICIWRRLRWSPQMYLLVVGPVHWVHRAVVRHCERAVVRHCATTWLRGDRIEDVPIGPPGLDRPHRLLRLKQHQEPHGVPPREARRTRRPGHPFNDTTGGGNTHTHTTESSGIGTGYGTGYGKKKSVFFGWDPFWSAPRARARAAGPPALMGGSAFDPGPQRRKKQRARLVPEAGSFELAETPVLCDAPLHGSAAGCLAAQDDSKAEVPNKKQRQDDEKRPASTRSRNASAFAVVANASPGPSEVVRKHGDDSSANAEGPVPIFVPVKRVSAMDILVGVPGQRVSASSSGSVPVHEAGTSLTAEEMERRPRTAADALLSGPGTSAARNGAVPTPVKIELYQPASGATKDQSKRSATSHKVRPHGLLNAFGPSNVALVLVFFGLNERWLILVILQC
jgi:hypothetical protein